MRAYIVTYMGMYICIYVLLLGEYRHFLRKFTYLPTAGGRPLAGPAECSAGGKPHLGCICSGPLLMAAPVLCDRFYNPTLGDYKFASHVAFS